MRRRRELQTAGDQNAALVSGGTSAVAMATPTAKAPNRGVAAAKLAAAPPQVQSADRECSEPCGEDFVTQRRRAIDCPSYDTENQDQSGPDDLRRQCHTQQFEIGFRQRHGDALNRAEQGRNQHGSDDDGWRVFEKSQAGDERRGSVHQQIGAVERGKVLGRAPRLDAP